MSSSMACCIIRLAFLALLLLYRHIYLKLTRASLSWQTESLFFAFSKQYIYDFNQKQYLLDRRLIINVITYRLPYQLLKKLVNYLHEGMTSHLLPKSVHDGSIFYLHRILQLIHYRYYCKKCSLIGAPCSYKTDRNDSMLNDD